MPRRHHDRPAHPPLRGYAPAQRAESGTDGDWIVRQVTGSHATKSYRCPGCQQEIGPGTAHVVAWPAGEWGGVEDRRHWHSACWDARTRRGPTNRRR